MRENAFHDAFCHDADEILSVLAERTVNIADVHATNLSPKDDDEATLEILHNVSGDLMCYVEGPSPDVILNIVKDAGIEDLT